jgi:hypothetical protein
LALDGLTLLDADTAKALAAFSGDMLQLIGLKTLTPEVAKVLATSKAKVVLP